MVFSPSHSMVAGSTGSCAMEGAGLVESSWEGGSSGPDRRVYSLTPDGLEDLHRIASAIAEADALMGAYLSRLDDRRGRRSWAA